MSTLKEFAWRCGDITGVIEAPNRGKARYRVYLSANDAGFPVEFKDIEIRPVHRAPWLTQEEK